MQTRSCNVASRYLREATAPLPCRRSLRTRGWQIAIVALLSGAILGCSSSATYELPDPVVYNYAGEDAARLIIFRRDDEVGARDQPAFVAYIRIGADPIGKLYDRRFLSVSMRPGDYRLGIEGNEFAEQPVMLRAGTSRYVRLDVRASKTLNFTLRRCGETSDTVKVCKDPEWRFDPVFVSMPADGARAVLNSLPAAD